MADPRPVNTGFDLAFGQSLKRFRDALTAQGIQTNIISGVRSPEEHQMAWDNFLAGRAGKPLPHPEFGPVPAATPPGAVSTHDVGLGADVQPVNRADLSKMYAMAPQYGINYLGGRDPYHFQLADWQKEAANQPPQMPWSQAVAEAQRSRQQGDFPTQYASNAAATTSSPGGKFKVPGITITSTGDSAASNPVDTATNSNVIDTLSKNIASIESRGWKNPYEALNPTTHAVGKYQVMPNNIPGWTQMALGQSMTPEEFKANPQAQEAVFRDQMQRSLQLYGPKDAASIWFTGKPYDVAGGAATDANKTTNASYVARATAGLDEATVAAAPGATKTAAGAPPAGAGLFGGFKTQADADAFQKNLSNLSKATGGKGLGQDQGQGQGQSGPPDIQPSQMVGPPSSAQNVSPLLAMTPMTYGQTINSLQDPATWYAPPGGRPQPRPQQGPMGTSLNSLAAIDPNMTPFPQSPIQPMGYMGYGYPGGGMGYG